MPKVLFILGGLHNGGSENYLLRFMNTCHFTEFDFSVLSANPNKGELHQAFIEAGSHIIYQPIGYLNPKQFHRFFNVLKKGQYDAVCTFTGNFGGVPLTIARLAGVSKRIAWHRRSTDAFGKNPLKRLYNQFINRLLRWNATAILSNSDFALEQFYGNYRKKDIRFLVLPNGVDKEIIKTPLSKQQVREKFGIPKDVFLIGHVGRYDRAKNHKTIFEVASRFKKAKLKVCFLFCGRGTESEAFREELNKYKISDSCFSLGVVDRVGWVYKSMDVFFFPSVTEGQPNALIEAMLAGLPVLTSNIPPILEMLPPNHELTFEPNDVDSFFKTLKGMKEQGLKNNQRGIEEWATNFFEPTKIFNQFKKLLREQQ